MSDETSGKMVARKGKYLVMLDLNRARRYHYAVRPDVLRSASIAVACMGTLPSLIHRLFPDPHKGKKYAAFFGFPDIVEPTNHPPRSSLGSVSTYRLYKPRTR